MNQMQKEELRRLVRTWLAERGALSFNAHSVHRGVSREIACTEPEVEDALTLLTGMGQVSAAHSELGSTLYYKVTAAGILANERGA